ncbi:MAG: hypothetical protein QM817_26670 [Archangium sp.]
MGTPDAQLLREADFTLEDLEANRRGKLTMQQLSKHRPGNGGFVFMLFVSMLLFVGGVGGAAVFYDSLRKPVERVDMNGVYALAAGGLLFGFAALGIAISILRSARTKRAVIDTGVCIFWDIDFAFTREQLTFKDYFYIRRGEEQLSIWRNLARVMKPGGRYRVYIAGGGLVSLEPLD